MADAFKFSGSWIVEPVTPGASGDIRSESALEEGVTLGLKQSADLSLTSDPEVAVSFGALTSAAVVIIRTTGGAVTAKLTSASGTEQIVPVDPFACVISRAVPFTALTLTRTPGVVVKATVFLGQKA